MYAIGFFLLSCILLGAIALYLDIFLRRPCCCISIKSYSLRFFLKYRVYLDLGGMDVGMGNAKVVNIIAM